MSADKNSDSPCVNWKGEHVGSEAWWNTQEEWSKAKGFSWGGGNSQSDAECMANPNG